MRPEKRVGVDGKKPGACPKCRGSGWVWGAELDNPSRETDADSLTRYSCDLCRTTDESGGFSPDLFKVTVRKNGATHVNNPHDSGKTLCGRRWHFHCDHGTDSYCRRCQEVLAARYLIKKTV